MLVKTKKKKIRLDIRKYFFSAFSFKQSTQHIKHKSNIAHVLNASKKIYLAHHQ
jgi:hypothetical protein